MNSLLLLSLAWSLLLLCTTALAGRTGKQEITITIPARDFHGADQMAKRWNDQPEAALKDFLDSIRNLDEDCDKWDKALECLLLTSNSKQGATALKLAVELGKTYPVKLLVMTQDNLKGLIELAANEKTMLALLKTENEDLLKNARALKIACLKNYPEAVRFILEKGIEKGRLEAFQEAVEKRNEEIVKIFMKFDEEGFIRNGADKKKMITDDDVAWLDTLYV